MAKRIAFALGVILAVYMVFSAMRGIDLIQSGDVAAQLMGLAVIVVPLVGGYLIYREIRFGYATSRLGNAVDETLLPTHGMSDDERNSYLESALERGRAHEDSWSAWYCIALGYDLNSDRKSARESMRHAISLFESTTI